uniref:ATP synthase complex subunit 8 n=1 Tax=Scolopsis ciliata TaxID=119746 RepID=A0A4Y5WYV0_SCOCI|nr:ATP synthase F0 subunit 8 [Scolopsis ciliata]QDE13207.1 ATP synthase F0 subunit 8 [Scolopsis ciliata]QQY98717.1 ATP subunit 8 [Scolopsis ciliata]
MPQLNPAPWFAILVFSWVVFLVILPSKVMGHLPPNDLAMITIDNALADPWSWPWY